MTKTKLLWAGLITGAVALGTGCATEKAARTSEPVPAEDTGIGGAGEDIDTRTRGEDMTPIPEQEGTREWEPEVHETPLGDPPGTGGSGDVLNPMDPMDPEPLDGPEPLDRPDVLGGDRIGDPLNPGMPVPPGEGLR